MEKALLWKYRRRCCSFPQALPKLLESIRPTARQQLREARFLLDTWAPPPNPTAVLDLLDERFGGTRDRTHSGPQCKFALLWVSLHRPDVRCYSIYLLV